LPQEEGTQFFVALQLWWVDRITRIGRAAYAPKRCLNTLLNIERETFFGKPNNVLCYTLMNGYINILCGVGNNTRLGPQIKVFELLPTLTKSILGPFSLNSFEVSKSIR
jgi:hypothetical protein